VVEHAGGQATSDLWLIDAVAATIPAEQLYNLAACPDVRSVVGNKIVNATTEPGDRDGWVSKRREKKGTLNLAGPQPTPVVFLPDGGYVSVTEKGGVLIVNADSSERARLQLPGGNFKTAPAVGVDGSIYMAILRSGCPTEITATCGRTASRKV
jgi:hypothetical protein